MMRKLSSLFLFIRSCLCLSHAKPRWIYHSLPHPVGVYYSFYLDRLCPLFILLSQPDWLLLTLITRDCIFIMPIPYGHCIKLSVLPGTL
jgi:hypothetical protein